MQTSPSQTEVFNDMKDFDGLLKATEFLFLRNDEVDVNVGVYEIAIARPANSTLNAHEAVLLCALENRFGYCLLGVARLVDVRTNPANIFATPESPLFQTITSLIQTLRGTTPEEHERTVGSNLADIQICREFKVNNLVNAKSLVLTHSVFHPSSRRHAVLRPPSPQRALPARIPPAAAQLK